MPFIDRPDAGRRLARRLEDLRLEDPVVLGLPRGGVPVGYEVAKILHAPLDVIVVRKLGVPWMPEFAMGAIGEGGSRFIDERTVRLARISPETLAGVERRERAELERRANSYRIGRPRHDLTGCTAIVTDDGIATGATARAACAVARQQGATRVVLAAPVIPADLSHTLLEVADEVAWVEAPDDLLAVGNWYADFEQISDADVIRLLDQRRAELQA
jgi:putative phosphoribosyl transferase